MRAVPSCKMQRKRHIYVDIIIQRKNGLLVYKAFTLWTIVLLIYKSVDNNILVVQKYTGSTDGILFKTLLKLM